MVRHGLTMISGSRFVPVFASRPHGPAARRCRDASWTPFCGWCAPALLGAICRRNSALGKRCMDTSIAGRPAACSMKSSTASSPAWRKRRKWTTNCGPSTARSSGPPAVPRGAEKKGIPREPPDHALGRSRGGLSTKIHILCNGRGLARRSDGQPGSRIDHVGGNAGSCGRAECGGHRTTVA